MALTPIIYDPADSHLGDTLRGSMIKITNNFAYLLSLINDAPNNAEFEEAIADIEISLANLLALINTKSPIGHLHPISDIVNLQSVLDSKVGVITFNQTIDNINQTIALLNQQIADIYVDLDDAPSDGKIYGRLNETWKDINVELGIPAINAYAYQLNLQIIALQDEINDLDISGLQADIFALSGVSVTHTTQISTLQTTKQNNLILTTNSGATATLVGDTLNIPPASNSVTTQITITGNTTIDNTFNNAIVKVKANAIIIIPSTLMDNFSCVFRTFAGATVTFTASSVTMDAPKGLILQPLKMATLFKDGAVNTFILEGELST